MGHSITETKGDDNLNCLVSIMYPTDSDRGIFFTLWKPRSCYCPRETIHEVAERGPPPFILGTSLRSEWSESCSGMSDCLWSHGLYSPWTSSGWNTGVGSCSLLQGIFPTQGSNPGLPHCRLILYQLSHQGSPFHTVVVQSLSWFDSLGSHGLQHAGLPCPSPSPKVCPSSCSLHWWCHAAVSFFDTLFSFCPQSSPASGTIPKSHQFESGLKGLFILPSGKSRCQE